MRNYLPTTLPTTPPFGHPSKGGELGELGDCIDKVYEMKNYPPTKEPNLPIHPEKTKSEPHDNKQEYDAQRQAYLESYGLKMYRISDSNIKHNIELVMRDLEIFIIKNFGG